MPASVVNHLHFRQPPDKELFAGAEREVVPRAKSIQGFLGLHVIEAAPDHFILVILGDDAQVLEPPLRSGLRG